VLGARARSMGALGNAEMWTEGNCSSPNAPLASCERQPCASVRARSAHELPPDTRPRVRTGPLRVAKHCAARLLRNFAAIVSNCDNGWFASNAVTDR
jgi:hypothetical protein